MKLITVLSGALILCAISVQSEKIEASPGEVKKCEEEAPENDQEVESNWFELQHETIEQQADQPTSGEQFIAIRIGAAGSKDQVNPNLVGLVRMATQFLPKSYTFINVLSASREVVAGIKYELLIKALDENNSEVHCDIRILEQPWIIINNNEKLRTLIYSNCSSDQAISNEPKGDVVQHHINPIFNNEEKIMTAERLKDMESLIMPNDNKTPKPPTQEISSVQPETIDSRPKEDEEALPVITLSKGTSNFLDDFFSFGKETKPKESSLFENEVIPKLETPTRIEAATIHRDEQENTIYGVASNANKETPIVAKTETLIAANTETLIAASTEKSIAANTETSTQAAAVEVNNNEEQVKEEVSIQCALTPTDENAPVSDAKSTIIVDSTIVNVERQKRESLDMERVMLTKLINAALARLDQFDEDDNKRILLNVLDSHTYRNIFTTDVRIADTKCSEISSSADNCKSQIIDDSTKLCRLEIEYLRNTDIKVKKSECAPEVRQKRQVGAPKPVTESEQEIVLGYLRASLANGDAPGYKLDRVIEITKKTVAGVLYKIKAQFEVEQAILVCNVEIWDRPWLGESAREVTFKKCDDPARRKRQIPGGINSLPNSDGEKLLNEVLSEGDYQSYRLVRLIESSQQQVAGVIYRIKAEFSVDHLTKVCVVKIWDRPWLGKSARQVEFNCDGSSRKKRQVLGGISPSSELDKSNKIAGLLNEVLTEGDYNSYRLVKIIESTIQRASGTIYKIKAEFSIEQSSKICNIKIWDRPWLGKSGREVEFNCDESPRPKRQIQGGFKSIKVLEKEIDTGFLSYMEGILKDILRNTDYQSYKLIRIIDTTSEVMSGFMYRIKAEFSVNSLPKICNIKIWDKESIQEREVQEFICYDPELNIFQDKPLITAEEHSNDVYILDGTPTSDVSTDSSDQEIIQIESLLNTALESKIYKSYKLVRIIEFTKPNVTDILYRIKASFKINETEQICDLELWQKTSDQENAIQQFNCNPKFSNNGFNLVSEKDKPKVEKLLREVLTYDDYKSYTLVRILQSSEQFVVGINYKVRAEMKVKGDLKICDIKILAMFTKHGKRVVQTVCQNVPGGLNSVPNDSPAFIESLINGVLLQGNYQSFRLVRIIEWSKQTREGVLYRVKAQFAVDGTQQICNLKIRDTISNQGREIQEFICDEPTESILGGISVTSEKDKPVIENILNEILTSGDYPSYKLVRIIESTKQIVKGILYRIKAEFDVDGTTKICNFKIWDKNFKEGRKVQEFTCVEPSRPLKGGITKTSQDEKSAIENILNGVLASGDYQRYKLLRIIETTKQIVAGILYRIRAEFSVDGTQKICNIKIWDKVSNQGREVQEFNCKESTPSIVGGSHVTGAGSAVSDNNKSTEGTSHATGAHTTFHEHNAPIIGGISATSEDDKTFIENILNGVLASGDYQSYRLVRIIESTKQIVAGILYRIKAEFSVDGSQKICNVEIWDKVSNQGREVQEFICEEPASSIVGGSHLTGSVSAISENNKPTEGLPHVTSAHTTFHQHNIPVLGGISATSEGEKTLIENILNGVLASGDYQSYRLLRIIESTKQIVTGILYRIKAEFSVDGTQKICNVKILDKISNQGREVQEFNCEESTPSIVKGSHVTGAVSAISENNKSTEGTPHATGAHTAFHEHNIPVLGGISATSEGEKTLIENILNGVLASGDYKSYRLVRIIESTKQIVTGVLYRIKAEFSVDGTHKICNVKILDKISNQGREVQEFNCEESTPSIVGGSHVTGAVSAISENNKSTEGTPHATGAYTTFHEHNAPIIGGISATSEDDKTFIENILNGVLASGDYQSYRLVRIIESTKQIVAGILYRIKAEFSVDGTHKICNVEIWDKVSNQGREVQEFNCEESTPSIVGGSHVTGAVSAIFENNKSTEGTPHATGAHTTFHEHNIPVLGGISATSEGEKTFIENILNGVLASGDYKSYRLVRIIESTKQIVTGILYRIKAEFSVDGTHKICNVKILDKISNQGREVQEFNCEESTSSIVGGSHVTGAVSAISENNKSTEGLLHATGAHTTFHEHNIPVLGGISATSEGEKTFIENILNGVLASGDYKSYRLVRIIESTKQIVTGILYRIKAEFSVDGTHKICNVKILDKISNQGREVQEFNCEESTPSIVGGSHVTGAVSAISENNKSTEGTPHATGAHTTFHEHNIPVLGGISATSEGEKTFIENILNGVLASGDYKSYRLVRIIESTKQIVTGILYRIKAEFSVDGTHKICNVKILDKISNQGREVQEFNCEESTPSIVGGSHVTGAVSAIFENNKSTEGTPHATGAHTAFHEHNIPVLGGISATSEGEKTLIENILNGVLASGDYQSYRLLRIIKSTKQIVTGILYRIKAEFSVDGTHKICNVKILDKISNQGREVQEFNCEESTPSIVGGSHVTGAVSAIFENNKSTEGTPHATGAHTTFHEHNIPVLGGISATSEGEKTLIENILNGVLASGDYQSYRLLRIIKSTKQIVAGILYRIKAEFSVDGTQKICNVKILDKISNQGREVQEFNCEESTPSIVKGSHVTGAVSAISENNKSTEGTPHATGAHTTFHEHNIPVLGGISATSEDEKTLIENILNGVLASGDYQSYRLLRIIKSTKQIVAGILYRIKAEFSVDGTQKICNVKILDKISNQGREVQEFNCEESTPSIVKGSHVTGAVSAISENNKSTEGTPHATGAHTTFHEHNIPVLGGISATSEGEKTLIENILNGVLASGDYKSYRLVRIIESTKQIVTGILYRIKAEFSVDGTHKICNVKILDKISNQGREVQEFNCEESTPSIVGGSHVTGAVSAISENNKSTEGLLHATGAHTTFHEHNIPIAGGISATSEGEKTLIENILNGVLASGDYKSYRLLRIIESTKQIVTGILYRIKAEFSVDGTHKICNVKILDKISNQGREVQEFNCEESTPSIVKGSHVTGAVSAISENNKSTEGTPHATGAHTTFHEHNIPVLGGISATSEGEKTLIENILNGVLASGDYQSYRLVRIIESTKQIVTGILYRIKAEFSVDGTHKICNVKILDKISNQGREVQEFNCEESTPSIVGGSHVTGAVSAISENNKSTEGLLHATGAHTTFHEHNIPIAGGISISATSEGEKTLIENILNGVLASGDYKSYRLVRIIESTKQIVTGVLYRIKAEFSVDGTHKICNVKILDKISNQGREVQEFNCEESTPSIVGGSHVTGAVSAISENNKSTEGTPHATGAYTTFHEHNAPIIGGISATSEDDKTFIENILNGVLASGDYQSYRLVRIIESTKQIVAGILYRIKAEFSVDGTHKICNVEIWDKVSNQGREVQEFNCEESTPSIVGGSHVTGAVSAIFENNKSTEGTPHATGAHTTFHEHNIPVLGGISATSEGEKTFIENILNGVLASGDYKSYRLVRIIESTKQIVTGILYRIKAEFSVDGTHKICNVKILDKISNQGREVQEFNCEESTSSIVGGSHVTGAVSAISENNKSTEGLLHATGAHTTFHEHNIPIVGGISATSEDDKTFIENILNGVLASGDYKSYRLVRIIESTKQIVTGILYRIKAEFSVDGTHKICNVKILDKISNQGREFQEFNCEESTPSIVGGSHVTGAVSAIFENNKSTEGTPHATGAHTTFHEHNIPIAGGISATSEGEKTLIENILNGVLASGDYKSYRLVRIIESTKQIVTGILYRIKAEFSVDGTHKICNVKILDKISNQGREVQEFNCEESTPSIVKGSHVTGAVSAISENNKSTEGTPHATGAHTTFHEHNIPVLGGISATSEGEKTLIENILNGVLASGDYQSYRLVRIIESTKQIVTGILYRIKAEFSVDGTHKICNVKILDKISNQGREVQEFNCEESTSSIVGGSHVTGAVSAISENNKSTEGLLHATGAHTTFHEHNIPIAGGISATSEGEKTFIENILNGVLASGDYKSYRLVRIIESTKQIVAGILYRIKAEFSVDGTQKICKVEILDKVSNQGREVQEFNCEESTPSIVGGSHVTGAVSAISENNKSTEGTPHATGAHTTFHEHNIPVLGGISATSEGEKTLIENILNGVLASGDYQSYRLLRIIKSTKQIVTGILYRIKAEFSVDGTHKICNVKILDKISNQGREVQEFNCEESTPSIVKGSHVTGAVSAISENNKSTEGTPHATGAHTTFHEHNIPIAGGISATSEGEKTLIENILNGVLASGDYQSYRLVRIIESTKQIVTGILYRIKAEFSVDGTHKICNVKILDKISNQGREVQEFNCEESTPSIVGGSHVTGAVSAISENNKSTEELLHATGAHTTFHEHNIPIAGGISATSEGEKTLIENILNGVLASGDYQSYRLVRIIESTKQIVTGILYRIKAEFSVDGTHKICNVKILDKISNQGREVQEFNCEESTPSIVGGSHVTGAVSAISENNKSTEGTPHATGAHTTFHEHNIPIAGGISATSEGEKTLIENILNGVLASGDYKSYRLVRIIESTKQIVTGILYRIKAEFSVDGTHKICNVKILDKISNQGREVQEFNCEESTPSIVGGSHVTGAVSAISENNKSTEGLLHATGAHTTFHEHNIPIAGGISATSEGEKTLIENILNGVLASGDYQSYRLVRIIESTKQIVAGILYRIKAEFSVDGTQKICNVKILDKISNQGREVQEFNCEESTPSIVGGSHVTGAVSAISENNKSTEGLPHATGVHTAFHEHNIPIAGGISATSEGEKTLIENILNGVLASGDYKSYRLVRIIESTKQIVAGILYRIKAEFSVDGTQKICNVKILDKISNQGREVQEFNCEESTPSIVRGSHVTGAVSAISENNNSTEGTPHATGAHTTFHEHNIPVLGGISATTEGEKTLIEKILNGVLASGDYKSYRLVRIIESTKQIVAGILYRIKAEFSVDGTQKICNVKILDKISNQGREVQEFNCEESTPSIVGGSHVTGAVSAISENNKSTEGLLHATGAHTTFHEHNIPIAGGISATSEGEKTLIENILNGVLASGDYKSYRLVRIIESTKQIVTGILYRIKAEFSVDGTHKICNVKILDKISNQGREVQEFNCEESTPSIVGGSHVTGAVSAISENNKSTEGLLHATGAHTTFHDLNIPVFGGISATSEGEKTLIENILNGVLASGDYQSYRLVRIIESTKQIVTGILYRIKAEFSVDGTHKICNVKILDKISNQGREVQEFNCEESTPSIVGGSHVTGAVSAISENIKSTEGLLHATGAHTTFHEHNIPIAGGISATSEGEKTLIENILNGVLASGDYKSYRLVRIIESTKQIVTGILYRIKAEFSVDGTHKICNVKILDKISNQGREVQEFNCEESTPSIVGGSHVTGAVSAISENNKSTEGLLHATGAHTTFHEHNIPVLGGISATTEGEKTLIENILNGVLASGDYQSYRLVRIIESTKQIVTGILYRIKAEFSVDGTHKICNVKILDKISNQGREVQEFNCEESTPSIVGGSHVTGAVSAISENIKSTEGLLHATGAHTTFHEHNIPIAGGISATSEGEKTLIENILNGVLASGDYKSYRLVRIIESTKQIVTGILYRIKAEFSVDGTHKICNVKILDKISNQGREVQEFNCEESTPSIVGGSHVTGAVSAISENNKSTEGLLHATGAHTTFHEHNIPVLGGISATTEGEKTLIENILNGVLASGDYQSYRLVRIIESTKQIVAGILYRIKAEFSVDGTQKICNVEIWDKVSNQGREVQEFNCEESTPSIVGGSHVTGAVSAISENNKSTEGTPHATGAHTTFHEHNIPVLGGISATTEGEKTLIEKILNGVLASGDYKSYRLVRIIESTKQIVAGILYRIKAEFSVDGTQKICNVKILDKISNQGREVQEFNCEESTPSIVGGSHVTGAVSAISENNKSTEGLPHATGVHTAFHEHNIPVLGGISATSEGEKTLIENILNGVLASGDYQSYRLVRIIESTKQIVAGILYRIKAEFSIDGTQKICNVKILDKISNQGREVQEFICERPASSFIEGSREAYVDTATHDISRPPAESISASSKDDKSVVENILNGILAGGNYQSYKLVRIIEFSNEIREGVLYRIKADFLVNGVDHICAVEIWDRSAQQGHNISCRQTFPILGGFNSVPLDDISSGQNLLIDILAYDDYNKYKLVKVIESWRQIVNGVNYKIKAELTEKGVPKICNILILDKLTESGKHVAEFDCKNITEPDHDIQGQISPITVAYNSKIESLLTEVLSQGNFRSYRLVRVIESTIETVSGILYKIKAEFEVDGSSNVCNVKIWDRPGLGKSERQVKIKCDEQLRHKRQVPGVVLDKSVTDMKIESILNEVLVAGDYSSYRLIRIIESTTQVVAGNSYRIKAEFSIDQSTKVCIVKIWDRPWLGKAARQVEFNCEGLSRRKRQIKGGIKPVSEENKPYVANLLNEVLTTGDYQSYRLIQIIETTKQVVAGTKYRIKAEFDLDGAEKICDITIWEKINNEVNEVTFSCVRKRAIRRRSHGSSSSSSESSGSSESSERSNKNKIRNVLYDVLDDDDYKSYSLVRINQGSRQKLSSRTLYYIEAIFLVDRNEIQCNVNINQRSRTDRKVHFNCDQPTLVLPPPSGGTFTIIPISERGYIQNLVTEVLSEGEYQSYRLLRIIEASSQEASGYKYRIKADFAVEQVEKICVINIWVKLSNRGKEITEFTCEEPQEQQEQNTVFLWRKTRQVLGGTTEVSEFDKPYVASLLNDVVLTGEYQLYSLIEIIESKQQIVQGTLYTIKAKFNVDGKTQTCTVTIWDRPWLGKSSRQVEFKECVGDTSVRNKREVAAPGSVRPVEQSEYPKIEEMLNTALAAGEQQNYRLARVLHAFKQLTSGWTYKIRGAFEVDGVTKRCNIKLWNRPWLSNASTIESFKCDEHDEATIRLNHDDKIKRTLDHYLHNNFTDNKIFEIYEKLYNKNYQTTLSRNMRLRIFKTNIRKIRDLNRNERGTATYGITEFADLTPTEYRLRTGLVRKSTHTNHISNPIAQIPNVVLPREFDWRTKGVVSQVKNQGSCGSCWAFSVIGNIEGLHAIKTGSLEEYSEQELVDCDTIDNGCNGGLPDDAYKAIEQIGGLETEKDYPYTAHRDHCAFNVTKVKTQIKGAVDLPKNETAIAQWLLQNGPVSIGINANAMQFYRGGVSHPWHMLCSKTDLDHGVLIVGFGVHDYPKFKKSLPYWIVKNSWGPSWGEQGYYRVYRGDNTCGVSEMVSSAVLE